MVPELQQVMKELKGIKEGLRFIKEHMFDPDSIMTTAEAKRFEQSMHELDSNKTTSLADLKQDFCL